MKANTVKVVYYICAAFAVIALFVLFWSPLDITLSWANTIKENSDTLAEIITAQFNTWPIVMGAIVSFWFTTDYWLAGAISLVFGFFALISWLIWKQNSYVG